MLHNTTQEVIIEQYRTETNKTVTYLSEVCDIFGVDRKALLTGQNRTRVRGRVDILVQGSDEPTWLSERFRGICENM